MKLVKQSWEWVNAPSREEALVLIEKAGRTCYKSEAQITQHSAARFVKGLIRKGHHSVIEHVNLSARIITNRGVTHELVRHRLASYSQESTRYCNYGGDDVVFIEPVWEMDGVEMVVLTTALSYAEDFYKGLLRKGWRPEQAREVLPNALKTEIVVTANVREWRHIFGLRRSINAHPQMRALMEDMFAGFVEKYPEFFEDMK